MIRFPKLSIAQRLSLSFMATILVGSLLLSLPFSHWDTAPATSYLDHLFQTVSMVCVTGLSVFPVAHVYNPFGQAICLALIQIGGLGLVSLIAISYYTLKKKLLLHDHELLKSSLSRDSSSDLRSYLFSIYKLTLTIEGIGALLLMIDLVPRYGVVRGIGHSVFLAISAFCNAGFDNLGGNSLIDFATNPLINLVIAGLILSGGIGFVVWLDIIKVVKSWLSQQPRQAGRWFKKLTPHSKLMLLTSLILLSGGTIASLLLEWHNPDTIGHLPIWDKVLVSFFQTVTMRTAGFATISYSKAGLSTNIIYMLQMLIGGAPGGTAGGLKLSVLAIMFLLVKAEFSGRQHISFAHRTISGKTLKQTLTILIFYFIVLISSYLLLLAIETKHSPLALLFEAVSAIATVGVSMDLTPQLSRIGQLLIMFLMFVGRVGPITVLMSIWQKKEQDIHYAETNILIG